MTVARSSRWQLVVMIVATLLLGLLVAGTASADRAPAEGTKSPTAPSALNVQNLTGSLTAADLANALVGEGVVISNVVYQGGLEAAGSFSGGNGIIGFDTGIILSSGAVTSVIGPNEFDNIATSLGLPGDPDLAQLTQHPTYDAAVLEFDFVPNDSQVFFKYVFASDEYNEFVNTEFNDVFAFYVNDVNCALVEGDPVSINTVNNGNPEGDITATNPEYYINNDLDDGGGTVDTEMDGLTVVLNCAAAVNVNETNHMKLAIADASDGIYDSAVFIEAGSLTTTDVSLSLFGGELTDNGHNGAVWMLVLLPIVAGLGVIVRRRRSDR